MISRAGCWLVLALAGVAGGLAAGCAPTLAVASYLVAAWPAPDQSLASNRVSHVDLTFNRPVAATSSVVQVLNRADGHALAAEIQPQTRSNLLSISLGEALSPGAYLVQWHAVNARTLVADDGTYGFATQANDDIAPHLDLSQDAIGNGEVLNVKGQGFRPRAQVRLTIGDDDVPLKTVTSDARGGFNEDARVPSSVAFGVQPVAAVDEAGNRAAAALKVRWGGWPPVLAFTLGQPGPGPREVTLSVTLRNRSDYLLEAVHVTMTVPASATLVAAEQGGHFNDGVLSWDLSWLDRGVAGPLRATFRADAPLSTHATIQFRHRRPHGCEDDECLTAFVSETASDSAPVDPL